MSDLAKRVRVQLIAHIELATKYEEAGNADAARELRAVANLLGVLLEGGNGKTVLPNVFAPRGFFYCYSCGENHVMPKPGEKFCHQCHKMHPIKYNHPKQSPP